MKAPFIALAGLLLLSCHSWQTTGSASDGRPTDVDGNAAPGPPPPPSADELAAHVAVLADNDFEGRGTLEVGEALAAEYLARHFASFGLEPLPGQHDFKVPVRLLRSGFDPAKTRASIKVGDRTETLVAGIDFSPFSFSSSGTIDSEIVFAGYGITAPKLGYDDYKGIDAKGKIVLLLRHSPIGEDKQDRFQGTNHMFFVTKAKNAQKHGAIGMVVVTDPKSGDGDDFRMTGSLQVPPAPTADPQSPEEGQPAQKNDKPFYAIHISQTATERLLEPTGKTLVAIEQGIDRSSLAARDISLGDASIEIDIADGAANESVTATDVIGFLPGSDPTVRDEWVVVGAHYDHLGSFVGDGDTIYNGADDNASGTATVLSLARVLALGPRPRRSVVFIGFSGEEKGLLGSRALLAQKARFRDRVAFMMNLDMVGRNSEDPVMVSGDGFASGLGAIINDVNADVGLDIKLGGNYISANSDHFPFFGAGIPVVNFFTGLHDDYHQVSDHPDKLDFPRMEKIATLALGVLRQLVDAPEKPRFIHRPLWFGAAIEVVARGSSRQPVVTEIDLASPAANAGVAVGDLIVAVGNTTIGNPDDIGELLGSVEPGATTKVAIIRGDQHLAIELTRAKRGYLGVFPRALDDDLRKKAGLPEDQGVFIVGVTTDGPANKAGIRKDDILIEIAGLPVSPETLGMHLARLGAGENVPIVLIRHGKRVKLTMVLGERPKQD